MKHICLANKNPSNLQSENNSRNNVFYYLLDLTFLFLKEFESVDDQSQVDS